MYNKRIKKIFLLLLSAVTIVVLLSSCYMEPDRTIDNDNNIGNNSQDFETLVTPTPTMTPIPSVTDTPVPIESEEPTATSKEPTASSGLNLDVFNTPSIGDRQTSKPDVKATSIPVPSKKIKATPKVTQKPRITSKPKKTTNVMKSGVKGSRVKELQQRLKRLGYYKGSIDGNYGKGTQDAVAAFQKANKLNNDGIAGNATLKKLYSNKARKASGSSSNNSFDSNNNRNKSKNPRVENKPRLSHMPSVPKNKYISTTSSSTGTDVRNLQNRLLDLGYLAGTADGVYGAATEKAIKAFQKANAPYVDGVAGPETLELLYSRNAKKASKPVAVVAKPGESLQLGDEGDAVRTLQRRLKELNYLNGSVDGSYGEATKQAVMKYQNDNGIHADGIAGSTTLNLLYTEFPAGSSINKDNVAIKLTDKDDTYARASSSGYTALYINDNGLEAQKLQNKLKELGYYKGENTGVIDEDTREAIMSFQKENHLTVDGVAGPCMQRMLYGNIQADQNYGTLEFGNKGDNVFNLQYALYELGYLQHSLTGIFDEYTYSAVSEFQSNNDLNSDGIANSKTLAVLYSSYAKPAGISSKSYNTLNLNSTGEDVISLQERLIELRYYSAKVNAIYDENTKLAVLSFQTYNNLEANGIADNITQAKLYSDSAVKRP